MLDEANEAAHAERDLLSLTLSVCPSHSAAQLLCMQRNNVQVARQTMRALLPMRPRQTQAGPCASERIMHINILGAIVSEALVHARDSPSTRAPSKLKMLWILRAWKLLNITQRRISTKRRTCAAGLLYSIYV